MSNPFKIQIPIFGSSGEFTVGDGKSAIRAKYILTKIKPGNDNTWACELASQMKPWREIFNIENLSFDELLQRDIDDSRVAHELIPYLLGTSGNRARFFPPILAVIVPCKKDGTGIEDYYPAPNSNDDSKERYGELFEIEQMKLDNIEAPMTSLKYNRQHSAFIIVDGQHRAMAILALHRQLNRDWGDNRFKKYYTHISVSPQQVNHIELPTCIIYFPDLHEDNFSLKEKKIDLSLACREIFLVVNRSAKRVSKSRELLLDDEDIAAHLMRKTLSTFKKRGDEQAGLTRIHSISHGDSDTEVGEREVISGQLTYSSAITLHKAHRAISFGPSEAFSFQNPPPDISDGRRTQNPDRSPKILIGTSVDDYNPLSYKSGSLLPPEKVHEIVNKLGKLADIALVNLFDKFRPFEVHNIELQNLKNRLSDAHPQSDHVDRRIYPLIFEGSGVMDVFESHFENLKGKKEQLQNSGQVVPSYLEDEISHCQADRIRFNENTQKFQRLRACHFFSIDYERFFKNNSENEIAQNHLEEKARKLFQTLATQAFQLGYVMAIFTVVEELIDEQPNSHRFLYKDRRKLVKFVTHTYLSALNTYFSPKENVLHRTLTGYINEPRASIFEATSQSLRGLLAMSVNEINERQWRFFRYAILEIVHSPFCWNAAQEKMKQISNEWTLEWYKTAIPRLVEGIILEREKYVEDAVDASVKGREFESLRMQTEFEAKGSGKSPEQINHAIENLKNIRKADAEKNAQNHLKASLKIVEEKEDMIDRLKNGLE